MNLLEEFKSKIGYALTRNSSYLSHWTDKFNYAVSMTVLSLVFCVAFFKSNGSYSCYPLQTLRAMNVDGYSNSYCWMHGTFYSPFDDFQEVSRNLTSFSNSRYIHIYRFVPIFIIFQIILFILPQIFWTGFCLRKTGKGLQGLTKSLKELFKKNEILTEENSMMIALQLNSIIRSHQKSEEGIFKTKRFYLAKYVGNFTFNKNAGTWLTSWYLFMKIVYLTNSIMQLYFGKNMLAKKEGFVEFFKIITRNFWNGIPEFYSPRFPIQSYCDIEHIYTAGGTFRLLATCSNPSNLFFEVGYKLIGLLLIASFFINIYGLLSWICEIGVPRNRYLYIKKLMIIRKIPIKLNKRMFREFAYDFMHADGVFIMKMLNKDYGDYNTINIVNSLWNIFQKSYYE